MNLPSTKIRYILVIARELNDRSNLKRGLPRSDKSDNDRKVKTVF